MYGVLFCRMGQVTDPCDPILFLHIIGPDLGQNSVFRGSLCISLYTRSLPVYIPIVSQFLSSHLCTAKTKR